MKDMTYMNEKQDRVVRPSRSFRNTLAAVASLLLVGAAFLSCLNPIGFVPEGSSGVSDRSPIGDGDGGAPTIPSEPGQGQPGETNPGTITDKELALLYTHNLSKTAVIDLIAATLSNPSESLNKGPVVASSVYSTTHTPSVTPEWSITLTYRTHGDPATPHTITRTRPLLKLGQINYINHIWFYKDVNGDYQFDETDQGNGGYPSPDPGDLKNGAHATIRINNKSKSTTVVANITPTTAVPATLNIATRTSRASIVDAVPPSTAYSITGTYTNTDTPLGTLPSISGIQMRPGIEKTFYFYKDVFGDFHLDESPMDVDPIDSEPGTTTPPSEEGEFDDPAQHPDFNKNILGILILRNITGGGRAKDLLTVEFDKVGTSLHHEWTPGPTAGSDKAILLSSGSWDITMYFADASSPRVATKTIVAAAYTPVNYAYFYYKKDNGGWWNWSGNDFPPDYDPGTTITTPPIGGTGNIKIINATTRGSVIIKAQWQNIYEYDLNIPGSNNGMLQNIPMGTGSLRMKISGKEYFGNAMTVTVFENTTTEVTYTDSMEESILQPGFSLLRIDNRSSGAIVDSVSLFNRTLQLLDKNGTVHGNPGYLGSNPGTTGRPSIPNSFFEPLPGSISAGQIGSVLIADGEAASTPYNRVVSLDIRSGVRSFAIEEAVYVNNNIVTIIITDEKVADNSDKTITDPDPDHGSLRVFNAYSNRYWDNDSHQYLTPDFRIYKFALYSLAVPENTDANLYNDIVAYTWHNTNPELSPIYVGFSDKLSGLDPGLYQLRVIAGSYPWHMYEEGDPLPVSGITYNCGEIMISAGFEQQYHFSVVGSENDTPNGFVIFYLSNTSMSVAATTSYVEIVKPPKYSYYLKVSGSNSAARASLWALTASNTSASKNMSFPSVKNQRAWPHNTISSTQAIATNNNTTTTNQAFSGWTNRREAPQQYRIFSYGQAIGNTSTAGPFIIPAGEYWCRYWDNYSGGRQYGRNSTQWRYVNLKDNVGRTAYASMDDTTYFTWRGEANDANSELINPDTSTPWINPVLTTTISNVTANSLRLTWTNPSPLPVAPVYMRGVRIRVYKTEETGPNTGIFKSVQVEPYIGTTPAATLAKLYRPTHQSGDTTWPDDYDTRIGVEYELTEPPPVDVDGNTIISLKANHYDIYYKDSNSSTSTAAVATVYLTNLSPGAMYDITVEAMTNLRPPDLVLGSGDHAVAGSRRYSSAVDISVVMP